MTYALKNENLNLRRELYRTQKAYLILQRQLIDLQMEKLQRIEAEVEDEITSSNAEAHEFPHE